MFREWFFEYAGVSSSQYDLHLVRVGNGQEDVKSGGEYELQTDTMPRSHEQLLYGMDYSASPLEFEVEICTCEKDIPLEQQIEIKNWLFGQDGWKDFKVIDETQEWHLKCIFIPDEDIMSGSGLRGFRCTLKNVSPFWYGDKVEYTINNGGSGTIYDYWAVNKSVDGMTCVLKKAPNSTQRDIGIKFNMSRLFVDMDYDLDITYTFIDALSNSINMSMLQLPNDINNSLDVDSIKRKTKSKIEFKCKDDINIITKYGILKDISDGSGNNPKIVDFTKPLLKINKYNSVIYFDNVNLLSSIKLSFTPVYRLGAF